uniref:Uncharacterized protein n=1 Tax=Opuntia streptacantha TaxID=393608 RepID=A0A7C8ZPN6_OPUST
MDKGLLVMGPEKDCSLGFLIREVSSGFNCGHEIPSINGGGILLLLLSFRTALWFGIIGPTKSSVPSSFSNLFGPSGHEWYKFCTDWGLGLFCETGVSRLVEIEIFGSPGLGNAYE